MALLGLTSVAVVGDIAPIPSGFPLPHLPDLALVPGLLLPALSLAIIGLVQGAGIGRAVPDRDGTRATQAGISSVREPPTSSPAFFGGAPVGGSVQATALNVRAGSRTRWSAFFAGVFVIVVVLVATPLVAQVPLAVTAGILIVAAAGAIRPRAARDIWRADRLSAAVMLITFVLVLVIPLEYAVLAGAAISVLKYIYLASLDVRVVQITPGDGGRLLETSAPATLSGASVTVLDVYGSLFFAASPKIRESLPDVGQARCAVVVLRLRGRGTLHSTTIALVRAYAAELAAGGGRLYLAGVGPEMEQQLRRTGLAHTLGDDGIVPAGDELYGSCEIARQRGRAWLDENAEVRGGGGDALPLPPRE